MRRPCRDNLLARPQKLSYEIPRRVALVSVIYTAVETLWMQYGLVTSMGPAHIAGLTLGDLILILSFYQQHKVPTNGPYNGSPVLLLNVTCTIC